MSRLPVALLVFLPFSGYCDDAAVQAQRIGNIPVSATDLRHGVVRVHNAHLAFATPEVVTARSSRGGAEVAALRAS